MYDGDVPVSGDPDGCHGDSTCPSSVGGASVRLPSSLGVSLTLPVRVKDEGLCASSEWREPRLSHSLRLFSVLIRSTFILRRIVVPLEVGTGERTLLQGSLSSLLHSFTLSKRVVERQETYGHLMKKEN